MSNDISSGKEENGIVFVAGATGEIGRRLVVRLVKRGYKVRILYRSNPVDIPGVEQYKGDVRDSDSIKKAVEGVHTIISCLGTRKYFGKDGILEVDVHGTEKLVSEAKSSGVKHFVLLSGFGLDRKSIFLSIFSIILNRYYFHKALAENAVLESGVPFTIVRPGQFSNSPIGTPLINQTLPLGLIATVSRDTVAEVLASCVFEPKVMGAVFELFDGGNLPLSEQFEMLKCDGTLHLSSPKTPLFFSKS